MKILAEVLTSVRPVIHRRHRRQLRCIDCRADTDDLYQRVCVRAWRHRDKCRGSTASEIRHWVMAIAANECRELLVEHLDRKRRSLKRTGRIQLKDWDAEYEDDPLTSLIDAETRVERSELLRAALTQIAPLRREVIERLYIDEWPHKRIAERFGIRVDRSRALASLGLKQVRNMVCG
ncbi:MAG: RNA polymerase sigma factor [Pirellulaceae bacterium]|nr:RNA polymerase sigma factor [Pirellulaceae bacterium]